MTELLRDASGFGTDLEFSGFVAVVDLEFSGFDVVVDLEFSGFDVVVDLVFSGFAMVVDLVFSGFDVVDDLEFSGFGIDCFEASGFLTVDREYVFFSVVDADFVDGAFTLVTRFLITLGESDSGVFSPWK